MLDAKPIADVLSDRFGVLFIGKSYDDAKGQHVQFRPVEMPRTQGFSLELVILWRSIEVQVIPDSFAAPLIKTMESSNESQRTTFAAFFKAALRDGGTTSFIINDQPVDPLEPSMWPNTWKTLTATMLKSPIMIANDKINDFALVWASRLAGAILALLPLEPIDNQVEGEAEGGGKQVIVTRYERSMINKAACIDIRGTTCMICGFNFENLYGPMGSGFIEVHHINPVSTLEPGTIVDPSKDLIPLCSNCHSMLHRIYPPYKPEQLRAIITQVSTHSQPGSGQE